MNKLTAAQAAAYIMKMTCGKPCLVSIANDYRQQAGVMRLYAEKAAAKPSGVHCGYDVATALARAAEADERAVSVPAELRRLMGV